jgi:hypothetical protein
MIYETNNSDGETSQVIKIDNKLSFLTKIG